jgi:serine/threonine-protein phosphatase PPG1
MEEGNVLELHKEIIVVGDIHGQFFDLLEMFKTAGSPDT